MGTYKADIVLVYTPELTPRIKYIFDLIFQDILKKEVALTTSPEDFQDFPGVKFSYGQQPVSNNLHFQSSLLLYETNIRPQEIRVVDYQGTKSFFEVSGGELPFDPFSAAFYLVTRYEEYLPGRRDRHKRFRADDSVAFKKHFLLKPVVNQYALLLKNLILREYPETYFPHIPYTFTPTLDIDNAYAFKYKGALRASMALAKHFIFFNFGELKARIKVYSGLESDPYDSYDKQFNLHERYKVKPIYFFLLGNYSQYDRNLSHNNEAMVNLIKRVKEKAEVGIHPSYASNKSVFQLGIEKERLEETIGETVTKSRQHYLMLSFPETYENLIKIGITDDYTMGYASQIGFRASICCPFFFYNLVEEKQTTLRVHPFVAMDTTFKHYMKIRSSEICKTLNPIFEEVKKIGGNVTILFHNESISGKKRPWKRWTDIYEEVLRLATR